MTETGEYLQEDYCSSGLEYALDVFVVVKAAVLIFFSLQGIVWWCKRSFLKGTVIFILIISIAIVISEMAYRFTHRGIRFRYVLNAVSQWQVFACLTVMIGFTRKNEAANTNIKIRFFFIPVHIFFATLLIWGLLNDEMG